MTLTGPLESNLIKALGHPLRLKLLDAIIEHGEISPVSLAKQLGHPLPTVSRHVRMLRDLGFVELTRTQPRRGAVEHFYRAVRLALITDEDWERLPIAMRRGLARQTFRTIFAEASAAGADGGFDAADAHMGRVPLHLDDAGRGELAKAVHDLLVQAEGIQQRCDKRRARSESVVTTHGRLVVLHFDMANDAPPPADGARPTYP